MSDKRLKRIERPATAEERQRHSDVRQAIEHEVPPLEVKSTSAPPGIPLRIQQARLAKGLSWFGLAKRAGISDSGVVRDIELGRDVPLSAVQLVAKALGLQLELIEEKVS